MGKAQLKYGLCEIFFIENVRSFPPFFRSQYYFDKSVCLVCKIFGGNNFSSSFFKFFCANSESFFGENHCPTYFP
jgi:hypothetical protein